MALPKDKKSLADLVLPEAEIVASSRGFTVTSERLDTPRFVPFDYPGRCRDCKSTGVSLQSGTTKEGVTLYSNRFKGSKFIAWDSVREFPDTCFFRFKNHGQVGTGNLLMSYHRTLSRFTTFHTTQPWPTTQWS